MDTKIERMPGSVVELVQRRKLKWATAVNKHISSERSIENNGPDDAVDENPKYFAYSLRNPSVSNYCGLRSRLRQASVPWLQSFLDSGGLDSLFSALEMLGTRTRASSTVVTTFLQMECVSCIKSVMNTKTGLDFMLENRELSRLLTEG